MLKPKEVMEMLSISRATFYRLIEKGELPAYKVGGGWRFYKKDIEKYLNERRIG